MQSGDEDLPKLECVSLGGRQRDPNKPTSIDESCHMLTSEESYVIELVKQIEKLTSIHEV